MRLKKHKRQPKLSNSHTSSAPVTRYYRPVNQPVSTKKRDQEFKESAKGRFSISSFLNYIILLVVFALLFFATTMSTSPQIKLRKSSVAYHGISEYQSVASELFNSSIVNRSKVFFRAGNFEQEMKNHFPEISSIDAIIPLGGRDLVVSITTSLPLLKVQNGSEIGIIDDKGVYVSQTIPESDTEILGLRFASQQQNFQLGSSVLTLDEVSLINLLVYELNSLSTEVNTLQLKPQEILFNVADGQFEVRLKDVGYYIKLSTYSDAKEQVGAMKATLVQLSREGQLPQKYIDVRVPGRVFVQ